MLNGKDMKSVSMTGLYFLNWRFETLQKREKKKEKESIDVIIQYHIYLVKNNKSWYYQKQTIQPFSRSLKWCFLEEWNNPSSAQTDVKSFILDNNLKEYTAKRSEV